MGDENKMVRWKRNLIILSIGQFFVMGAMSSITPFLALYIQELGVTDPEEVSLWSGLIFAINFLTAFIFSPIWGKVADKYGRKLMVIRSGIGMAIIITLMGFVTNHIQLFILRLLNGVISGFIPATITLASTNTPKAKVGYALGVLQAGAVAGSIFGPVLGGIMADSMGFSMIFLCTGVFIFLATLLIIIFVDEKFERQVDEKKTSFVEDFKVIAARKPILSIFAVATMIQLALLGTLPLLSLFIQELKPGAENLAFLAGLTMAAMGFANMLASPQLGKLGDKYGAQHVLFFSISSAALFMLPQAFVTSLWQLIILRFLLGLSLGGLMPSVNALVRHYAPKGMESRTYGYSNAAIFLGNMLGPTLGGYFAASFGIRSIFVWATILLVGNAVWVKKMLVNGIEPSKAQAKLMIKKPLVRAKRFK